MTVLLKYTSIQFRAQCPHRFRLTLNGEVQRAPTETGVNLITWFVTLVTTSHLSITDLGALDLIMGETRSPHRQHYNSNGQTVHAAQFTYGMVENICARSLDVRYMGDHIRHRQCPTQRDLVAFVISKNR